MHWSRAVVLDETTLQLYPDRDTIWIWSGARDQESTNHSPRLLSESPGI